MIAKFFILSLFVAGAFGSKYKTFQSKIQNSYFSTFLFLGCADTCDDSVSAIKGFVAAASPAEVKNAVEMANAYLGLDLTVGDIMSVAENFDWCGAISAHPKGDDFCAWVAGLIGSK